MNKAPTQLPPEAIRIALEEFGKLTAIMTEDAAAGDVFLYKRVYAPGSKRVQRYSEVFGLNQLQRAFTAMLQLNLENANYEAQLHHVRESVVQLTTRASALEEESTKLTRLDFLLLFLFGKEYVVNKVRQRRIREGKAAVNLDSVEHSHYE